MYKLATYIISDLEENGMLSTMSDGNQKKQQKYNWGWEKEVRSSLSQERYVSSVLGIGGEILNEINE